MNESSRLVSVGLPTHNRLDRLRVAVASVLSQDYPEIELVISDNASSDGTEAFGRQLERQHPGRVRYLRSARNEGATVNFNRARSACTGDYVMWLGDDDELGPGYLAACVSLLEARPDAALVGGSVRYVDDSVTVRDGDIVVCDGPDAAERVLDYFRQVGDNGVFYGITRSSVAAGLQPLRNVMGNDWQLMAAVAYAGPILQAEQVEVRRSTGGATRSLMHVARSSGMTWFEGEFPQVAIAWFVLRDVGWSSPVYRDRPVLARLGLGLWAAAIVARRFVIPRIPDYLRRLVDRAVGWRRRLDQLPARRRRRSGLPAD